MLNARTSEMLTEPGLAERALRFRTVATAFHRNAALLFAGSAFRFEIDDEALARAFAAWRSAFDALQDEARADRRDRVIFGGGLLLKELLQHRVITVAHRGVAVLHDTLPEALTHWPEGYACARHCFSTVAAVIAQEGLGTLEPAAVTAARPFWASFRENVEEDARTAIGFFDLMCGVTPNWELPLQRGVPVPG